MTHSPPPAQAGKALPPRVWIALPKDDGIVPYMQWMKPEIKEEGGELFYRSYPGGPNCWIAVHWIQDFIPEARHKELMERAVGEAYQRGKRDAYKQANEYTDRCYAGLIAAEAESEEILKARAASSTGAGEEKV